LLRQAMLHKSRSTLSKATNIDELEEKGREELTRRGIDRGRVCDDESLALFKLANIRERS
jgi:hypothetical protein